MMLESRGAGVPLKVCSIEIETNWLQQQQQFGDEERLRLTGAGGIKQRTGNKHGNALVAKVFPRGIHFVHFTPPLGWRGPGSVLFVAMAGGCTGLRCVFAAFSRESNFVDAATRSGQRGRGAKTGERVAGSRWLSFLAFRNGVVWIAGA